MSVKKQFLNRLAMQAEEAEYQGLTKVAEALHDQINKQADVRETDQKYVYSYDQFQKDVESQLWSALIRVADFHNVSFDAVELQETIEDLSAEFIHEARAKLKVATPIGAYEPLLPGETEAEIVILDLDEEV